MLSIRRSMNPYLSGMKPRAFFEKRNEMLKMEKIKTSGRVFNPNWVNEKPE